MKKLLFVFLFFCFTTNAQDYYIHAGKLFDSESGKFLNDMTLVVSGKKNLGFKKRISIFKK